MKLTIAYLIFTIFLFSGCQKDAAELINVPTHAVPSANAGPSLLVQLPVSTITLIGSGSSQNGGIASVAWTLVSGPNLPIIVTPGLRTTVVNGLIKGTYIFQFSVIDSAGFIGVDTATVNVKPDPNGPQTLDLSVVGLNNELNFALFNNNNASFQNTELLAYSSPTATTNFQKARGAFKFDLSGIPSNATITSAKLTLYSNPTPITVLQTGIANGGIDNSFILMRLRSSWSTASTWALQPQVDTFFTPETAHTNLPTFDVEINVKTMIDSMRIGNNNNGFLIGLRNENIPNLRNFASSTYPIAAKRPKLAIVYQ